MDTVNWEQEYWRDQDDKQKLEEAKHMISTDYWYRLNGIASPYTVEEIKEAQRIVKGRQGNG